MKTLVMTRGLPGSGKTTWAKDQQRCEEAIRGNRVSDIVRVNKDDIRLELGKPWSPQNEDQVLMIRDGRITVALADPTVTTVISDDTNLAPKHEARLRQLAREAGAGFEIRDFTTSVEECIRRDSLRTGTAKVGARVIHKMAKDYDYPPGATARFR